MWAWMTEHFLSWWAALAAVGVFGILSALKPGALIKAFIDFRRGRARIRVDVEEIADFHATQFRTQQNHEPYHGYTLLESHKFKVRNISSIPAYVEDVGIECAGGKRFVAWRNSGQFLKKINEGDPVKIEPNAFERFVVRVPFDQTLGPVTHWFVVFNNGTWKVRSKSFRERLPSWFPLRKS
ncbi:hypothetical protein [Pseudomonas sp. UV AK001]|uniref:hypothetical protein n=1 Tax=Pseudomonas sp. UV AK001 TaxID=3384791 RepID=UPI0038D46871